MPSRTGLAALGVATALVSGCSDGAREVRFDTVDESSSTSPAIPAAELPNPCTMITAAALRAAFGADPGEGTLATVDETRRTCTYPAGFLVGVAAGARYDDFDRAAKANKPATCTPVADLGDRAFFCVVYGRVGQLVVRSGAWMYDVTGPSEDLAPYRTVAATLTR